MSEGVSIAPTLSEDLLDRPFRLLGVDPAANEPEIRAGAERAKVRGVASEAVIDKAREALLDPIRRLPYELAYPLGCPLSELDEWSQIASADIRSDVLLNHAAQLSPLSQASFFEYISTRRALDAPLLSAMIDALGRIDPTSVYDQLKNARRSAGYPPPSLAQVREQLDNQLDLNCQRAISSYRLIGEFIEPFCENIRQVFAKGETHQINILERFIGTYRTATLDERQSRLANIEHVCDEIESTDQVEFVDALTVELERWIALSRPILLHECYRGELAEATPTPLQRLYSLIIDLALDTRYERAIEIAALGKEKLSLISSSAQLLDEAAIPAEHASRMRRDRKLTTLTSLIGSYRRDPAALIAAIKQNGFGPAGIGDARQFWQVLVDAVDAAKEVPIGLWLEIQALAQWLHDLPGGAVAARSMLEGCLAHGPRIAMPQQAIIAIREDLRRFGKSTAKVRLSPRKPASRLLLYAGGFTILLCITASILFRPFQPTKAVVATLAGSFTQPTVSATAGPIEEEAAPPAVGTQQRLSLAGLRYCRFQEERIQLVKSRIQTAEDMRAFNTLAVDYNSRCSDFLYRDSDSLIVQAELVKNRQRLVEEADQIMSRWRGRGASR